MHEISIARNVLEIVQEHVPADQRGAVRKVRLRLGCLAGVDAASLGFCFEVLVGSTPLSRAQLAVRRVPGRAGCETCGAVFDVERLGVACPSCGGTELQIRGGSELEVEAVELDSARVEVA